MPANFHKDRTKNNKTFPKVRRSLQIVPVSVRIIPRYPISPPGRQAKEWRCWPPSLGYFFNFQRIEKKNGAISAVSFHLEGLISGNYNIRHKNFTERVRILYQKCFISSKSVVGNCRPVCKMEDKNKIEYFLCLVTG